LEDLARSLRLERTFNGHDGTFWEGRRHDYYGLKHSLGIMHMIYKPEDELMPVRIQTIGNSYWYLKRIIQYHVKHALKRAMEVTGSVEVRNFSGEVVMRRDIP